MVKITPEIRKGYVFKFAIIIIVASLLVIGYELIDFATDDAFWNSIPTKEETEYYDYYDRL